MGVVFGGTVETCTKWNLVQPIKDLSQDKKNLKWHSSECKNRGITLHKPCSICMRMGRM